MKKEISPVIAGVILVIVVAVVGFFIYKKSEGTTFTKSSARGIQFDAGKVKLPNAPP